MMPGPLRTLPFHLVWLLMAAVVQAEDGAPGRVDPGFHIYLLAGQSNMAGRGQVDAESGQAHPRVLKLNKELKWEPATDPVHFDRGPGVGPALSFGKCMAEAMPQVRIGLVPCAVGGSRIGQWMPGQKNYVTMQTRMAEALKAGVLKGILWHQGESNISSGSYYGVQLTKLIGHMRKDLLDPAVPFIAGEITDFRGGNQGIGVFNEVLHGMEGKVPRYRCIGTGDLKDKGDGLHYGTESARELGRRYAKAMLAMLDAAGKTD